MSLAIQKTLVSLFLIILLLFTAACTNARKNSQNAGQGPEGSGENEADFKSITVAAASDLRFAFEEIGQLFEEETGVKVVLQFGSSGSLAHQIAQGAPIDLYASANEMFIEDLTSKGYLLEDSKDIYAIGRIVLAVNKNLDIKAITLEDLLSPKIDAISLANPAHAPYGMAAKEALITAGLWEDLQDKLVYGENVSQAMQFVQTGNAPAGIIALSVANAPGMNYTLINESLHNPLRQMLAVVSESPNKKETLSFAQFINGETGRPIMEKYGFFLP